MIRSLFVILFLVVYFILTLPVMLILYLLSKKKPQAAHMAHQRMVSWAFRVICFLAGVRLTTLGLENIPDDQPVLFVGNHQSFFDIIISYSQMKTRTAFIGKKELARVPFLNFHMRFLECLFIDRENLREGVRTILKAAEEVKAGISIFIYPEGTRNKSGDELNLADFHEGSFRVAQKGGCPIIPVAINNSANILENHFPFLKAAQVVVEYGEPKCWDDFDKKTQKHLGVYYQNLIREMIRKNQSLISAG